MKVFQKEMPFRIMLDPCSPPLRAFSRAVPLPPSRGVTAGDTPDPESFYQSESERSGPAIKVSTRRKPQYPQEAYGPV